MKNANPQTKPCSIPGCFRGAASSGMCNAHLARYKRWGDPVGKHAFRDSIPKSCSVDGCNKPCASKGFCGTHYERMRKNGTLASKPKRPSGTGCLKSGYCVIIRHIEGRKIRIRRCRLVMEEKIGRPLLPDETVHHKNGNKLDDRPDNLELWASRHPKGQRDIDLVRYACEILNQYAYIN
jgi:hypothetical protein